MQGTQRSGDPVRALSAAFRSLALVAVSELEPGLVADSVVTTVRAIVATLLPYSLSFFRFYLGVEPGYNHCSLLLLVNHNEDHCWLAINCPMIFSHDFSDLIETLFSGLLSQQIQLRVIAPYSHRNIDDTPDPYLNLIRHVGLQWSAPANNAVKQSCR